MHKRMYVCVYKCVFYLSRAFLPLPPPPPPRSLSLVRGRKSKCSGIWVTLPLPVPYATLWLVQRVTCDTDLRFAAACTVAVLRCCGVDFDHWFQVRYGHMSVLPDMASLTEEKVGELVKIVQSAKDADTGKSADGEPVNVLHVALMKVRRVGWVGKGDGGRGLDDGCSGRSRRGAGLCVRCVSCVFVCVCLERFVRFIAAAAFLVALALVVLFLGVSGVVIVGVVVVYICFSLLLGLGCLSSFRAPFFLFLFFLSLCYSSVCSLRSRWKQAPSRRLSPSASPFSRRTKWPSRYIYIHTQQYGVGFTAAIHGRYILVYIHTRYYIARESVSVVPSTWKYISS